MINKLQWVAITRVRRAGTLGFALALALLAAPAAYGADGNPWHINIYGTGSATTYTVSAATHETIENPWHINIHGTGSATTYTVSAATYETIENPWHINIYGTGSASASRT